MIHNGFTFPPSALREDGQRRTQVTAVPNTIRTVLVDPLRRYAIGGIGPLFVAQPGIEPDRCGERWRRVHVGQQPPGFVQVPAHNAGCSLDLLGTLRNCQLISFTTSNEACVVGA